MWCDIKVTASYLWASSAIFVIKPKHDWQSRKTRQKLHNRTNICCNKHWKDCDVIILYLFLSHRLPVISYVVISVFSDQDHLNVPSMTEQERYLECFFFFFFTILQTSLPLSISPLFFFFFFFAFVSCFLLVQEHTRPGVIVIVQTPAYFLFCLRRSEKPQERKTKRKEIARQTERAKAST